MITDISDTGARLYCETEMPDTFLLAVSGAAIFVLFVALSAMKLRAQDQDSSR